MSGGTYGLWNDAAVSDSNTATSGALTLVSAESVDQSLCKNMLAGNMYASLSL
jgi:hypothetical protein